MAALIPELYVSDYAASLKFYTELLGFSVRYARADECFAFLEREGAELMIEQPIGRTWLTAPLERPFGRGINLQIDTAGCTALYERIKRDIWVMMEIERKQYRRATDTVEVLQFVIADPDGYLLRFSETVETADRID